MNQAEEWQGVARVDVGLCGVLWAGGAQHLVGLFDEECMLRPPTAWPLKMAPGTPGSIHQRSCRVTLSPMDSCTLEWKWGHFITRVIRSSVQDTWYRHILSRWSFAWSVGEWAMYGSWISHSRPGMLFRFLLSPKESATGCDFESR
jgi:hypothetical protein